MVVLTVVSGFMSADNLIEFMLLFSVILVVTGPGLPNINFEIMKSVPIPGKRGFGGGRCKDSLNPLL